MDLIVIEPFGPYVRGQRITNDADVSSIVNSEATRYVVRVPKLQGEAE